MKHIGKFAATLGAAVSLLVAGCSVTTNPDILYAINPPAHQLQLAFNGNTFADGAAVTMTKTLKSAGDKEAFTLKNISSASGMTVNSVTVDDATHFVLSGFTADTAIEPTSSSVFYVAFNDAPAATETLATTLRIAYRIDGHSRTQTFTLRATREVNTAAAMISITDDSGTAIANNDANAYDFGYSDTLTAIDKTFIVKNTGTVPLTISTIISDNTAAFSVPTNPQGTTIAAGSTTLLIVRRTDAKSANTATVTISTNAADYPIFKLNVKSASSPTATPTALIAVTDSAGTAVSNNDANAYDFGYIETAGAIEKTFAIKNIGTAPLTFTSIDSNNTTAFDITVKPTSVGAGSLGMLTVRRIDGTTAASATIKIISNAINLPTFQLNVQSQNKKSGILTILDDTSAQVSPSTYFDLGYTASGPLSRTFSLKNTGVGNLTILSVLSGNENIAVSGAPASGTVIASGGTATFSLVQASAVSTATAQITVTTGNGTSTFNVASGGSVINGALSATFAYKLSGTGYDFRSSATTKSITLLNKGTAPIVLLSSTLQSGTVFKDITAYPLTIPAGTSGSINVTYTPTGPSASDDAPCTLSDKFGRTYSFYCSGTGFKQPTDASVQPALWLRADRIAASNTVPEDSATKVSIWPDMSGNSLNASAVTIGTDTLEPVYNASGINGKPSLTWSGVATKECMKVDGTIINTTEGSTTFVVFRTSSNVAAGRYVLVPYYQTTPVYPQLYWNPWYFDTGDGYYADVNTATRKLQYRFNVLGYSNITRFPADSADKPVTAGKTYAMGLWYSAAAIVDGSPNIGSYINGTPVDLAYLHSDNSSTATAPPGNFGAYGIRVDNGAGAVRTVPAPAATDWCYNPNCTTAVLRNQIAVSSKTYNTCINSLYIGATTTATAPFAGEIAEILIYPQKLSDADMLIINDYLCKKYGATY